MQNDVEMPIPKYFVLEKAKALKEREKLLGQILSRLAAHERDSVGEVNTTQIETLRRSLHLLNKWNQIKYCFIMRPEVDRRVLANFVCRT